jgi:flagellar hook-associated protein 1 FlgK
MPIDLLSILSSSGTSLAAHRAAVAVASHNIDNASTPGYARQQADLVAVAAGDAGSGGFIGSGVRLANVTQVRDRFLESQIPASLAGASRSSAEAGALEAVAVLDPQASGGLGDALSNFYSSLRALNQNAGSITLRQAATSSARSLTLAFRQTAGSLEQARSGLDAQIQGRIVDVNQLAQEVAGLNGAIRSARATGAEPNDLLDARQKALDRLAEITGAVPVPDGSGDVSVTLGGGVALVTGTLAGSLETIPDPTNDAHLSIRAVPPGSSSPIAVSTGALGGEIGGYLDARDGALATAVGRIDGLAFDLAGAVNVVHQAGFGLDGVTGRTLFDVGTSAAGAATRIAVSAAVANDPRALAAASAASGLPGDATALQAILETERRALGVSGLDPTSTLADLTSQFGGATRSARAIADQDGSLRDHLQTMRQAASGVSLDEELLALQKAQRAYEAVAKVIQTSSEMLKTLMDLR